MPSVRFFPHNLPNSYAQLTGPPLVLSAIGIARLDVLEDSLTCVGHGGFAEVFSGILSNRTRMVNVLIRVLKLRLRRMYRSLSSPTRKTGTMLQMFVTFYIYSECV